MKKKLKLLICGGTGFIGKNLVEYFVKKNNFIIIATYYKSKPHTKNKKIRWVKVDLLNKNQVQKLLDNIDIILQAAATTSGSKDIVNYPHLHVTDNAIMNSILLREAFEKKIKHFIFFSCTVMYPSSSRALKEGDINYNNDISKSYYGVGNTKLYIEKMCKFYSDRCDTKFTIIRHTNIFGPHDKYDLEKSHFFGATINKIFNSKNNEIQIWGNGLEKRDLLYVEDLINFVDKALKNQKSKYEIFNCSYGKSYSINKIISKIITQSKMKITMKHDLSKPSIKTNILINSSKAYKELKWKPRFSIDMAIKKTITWYKNNKHNV